jgi:hypothetical protein
MPRAKEVPAVTNSDTAAPGAPAAPAEKAGFFREWVLPVTLGLAIGGGLVLAWRAGSHLLHSEAWNIVVRLDDENPDVEKATKDLRALGASARADLVEVLRDLPRTKPELKAWVAEQLAGEPWFDTTSLKELVRDQSAPKEDRRAAAGALIGAQEKEVDASLVLPVIEEWLVDLSAPDRSAAVAHLDRMWFNGMLGSEWETRMVKALRKMAERPASVPPEDAERIENDRGTALLALSRALPDDEIRNLLVSVALDESDADFPRMMSVRALAEGGFLDAASVPTWEKIAKVKSADVRQTVADNLGKTPLPEFDKVLEPLQFDAKELTRDGAIDSQITRRRPTMLARFDELLEDSYDIVRSRAMFACGVFKNEKDGLPQRAAMMLRLLETSTDEEDVKGALLGMKLLTDKVYGIPEADVHVRIQDVEATSLRQFMADTKGRKAAAEQYREHFGAACVWTDGDREKTLRKVLTHADPANVERAKAELAALKK